MSTKINTWHDLQHLSMGALVAIHNLINPDAPATNKTFSQRSKAVDRIRKLAADKNFDFAVLNLVDEVWTVAETVAKAAADEGEAGKPTDPTDKPSKQKQQQQQPQPVTETPKPPQDQPPSNPPPSKPKTPKEPKPKAEKKVSIRAIAEGLLLKVVGQDEDKRNVGMAYEDILAEIKKQFPEAKTSIACLRWYAVHMRERGTMPPTRPRAVPAAKEEDGKNLAQKIAEQQAQS